MWCGVTTYLNSNVDPVKKPGNKHECMSLYPDSNTSVCDQVLEMRKVRCLSGSIEARVSPGGASEARVSPDGVSEARVSSGGVSEARVSSGGVSEVKVSSGDTQKSYLLHKCLKCNYSLLLYKSISTMMGEPEAMWRGNESVLRCHT